MKGSVRESEQASATTISASGCGAPSILPSSTSPTTASSALIGSSP